MRRSMTASILVLAAVALSSCTGSQGSSTSAGAGGGAAVGAGPAAPPAPPAAAGQNAADKPAPDSADPAIVRTAEMSVRVRDVGAQADRARVIASALQGSVTSDERTGTGVDGTADLVLTVPTTVVGVAVTRVAALGTVSSQHASATDVSPSVADTDSRVANMRAAIARLRGLYARAGTITEVLAVEGQLSSREADLEALLATQRTLAARTALASVTVHLARLAVPPPPAPRHAAGFVGGLQRGWDGFVASLGWLLTAFGTVLPFLVAVGLLVGAATWVRRARRVVPVEPPAPG
jgi:Domain of unknown function (DUF4349)